MFSPSIYRLVFRSSAHPVYITTTPSQSNRVSSEKHCARAEFTKLENNVVSFPSYEQECLVDKKVAYEQQQHRLAFTGDSDEDNNTANFRQHSEADVFFLPVMKLRQFKRLV